MATNDANLFLRILSDSKDAKVDLATFAADLSSLDKMQAEPAVDLKLGKSQAQIAAMAAELKAIQDAKVKVDLDTTIAEAKVGGLIGQLLLLGHEHTDLKVNADTSQAVAKLALLQAETGFLAGEKHDLKFGADTSGALAKMAILQAELKPWEDVNIPVDADIGSAMGKLFVLQAEEHAVGKVNVGVDADIAAAMAKLILVKKEEESVSKPRFSIGGLIGAIPAAVTNLPNIFKTIGTGIQSALPAVKSAVSGFLGLGKAAEGGAGGISRLTANLGPFGARVTAAVGGLLVVVAVIGISLVGAVAALLASLGLAVIALGALTIALAAVAGPIIAVMIPAFIALGKAMQAYKRQQQSAQQTSLQQAQAEQQARQFAQQRADAVRTLTNALQQQVRTEQDNAQSIADAHAQQKQSISDLRDATVQAYRDMQDAALQARDAELALESARLSKEQAALDVKVATQNLKDFRKETKTAGNEFDGMFKKFSNVDFKGNAQAIRGQLAAGGAKLDTSQELKMEQLVLNVKDARLREKESTQSVREAQVRLTRAQQDNTKYLRQGIKANDGYRTALRQVASAQQAVSRAEKNAARASADAARTVANARRDLTRLDTSRAAQKRIDNLQKEAQQTKGLSQTEQRLVGIIKQVKSALDFTFGPATAAIINGVVTALGLILPMVRSLRGPFTRLGAAIGTAFASIGQTLASPAVAGAFKGFIDAATQVVPQVTKMFAPLLKIVLVIAQTAMPFLLSIFQRFAGVLTQVGSNPKFVKTFSSFIISTMPHLATWADLAWNIVKVLFELMVGLAPAGLMFVKWIDKITRGFLAWQSSDNGRRQITEFLVGVLPLAKEFATFVLRIIQVFLRLAEISAPVITPILTLLNAILNVIQVVLRPIALLAIAMGTLMGATFGVFSFMFNNLAKFITWATNLGLDLIYAVAKGIVSAAGSLWNSAKKVFNNLVSSVKGFLGIASPSKVMMGIGRDIIRGIITGMWNWASSAVTAIINIGGRLVSAAFNKLKNLFWIGVRFLKGIIQGAWSWLTSALTSIANLAGRLIGAIRSKVSSWFHIGVDMVKGLIKGMVSWIPNALKAAGKFATDLWHHVKKKLHIGSPSKLMVEVGHSVGEGVEVGLRNSARRVAHAATASLALPILNAGPRIAAAGSAAATVHAGTTIQNQTVMLPSAQGGGFGDPRHEAALFAREMKRRGGGSL